MNGQEVLTIWEREYGQLSEAHRNSFLIRHELVSIAEYRERFVVEAVGRHKRLSEVLRWLRGNRLREGEFVAYPSATEATLYPPPAHGATARVIGPTMNYEDDA